MTVEYLTRKSLPKLAYRYTAAERKGQHLPPVIFLGGFKSDMEGTKAQFMEQQCQKRGQAFLRFDYSGHGRSGGQFEAGTIGIWYQDALDVIAHVGLSGAVLVGSSMGGWIALLIALRNPNIAKALVGIAAAPDFTRILWDEKLDDTQREVIKAAGRIEIENAYSDDPYIFTKALFDDGKAQCLLDAQHHIEIPMSLIQGMRDEDVDSNTPVKVQDCVSGAEIDVIYIADGDHRLSRDQDLEVIDREVGSLSHFDDEP